MRTGQIAMTAGKQSIDESSDVGMHDVALSDSDSSADFDEGVPERPSTPKMPSACACPSNDPVFQLGKYKGHRFHRATKQSPSYFQWAIKQKSPSKFLKAYIDWLPEDSDFDEKFGPLME